MQILQQNINKPYVVDQQPKSSYSPRKMMQCMDLIYNNPTKQPLSPPNVKAILLYIYIYIYIYKPQLKFYSRVLELGIEIP